MKAEELIMTKKLLQRMFKEMEGIANTKKNTFTEAAMMHGWRKDLASIIKTMSDIK